MVRVEPRPHADIDRRVRLPHRGGNAAPEREVKTDPAATTLNQLDRGTSNLISGDVPECVAALESGNGPEIQVHGGPGLIYTLPGHYPIDELRVWALPWYSAPELGDPVRAPGGSRKW